MLPNTSAAASDCPSNVSASVLRTDSSPSSLICVRSPAADKPSPCIASSDCFVGRRIDAKICRNWTAASEALVPVRLRAAKAAPTSSKPTPIAEAIGKTRPMEPANSSDCNFPSRTAAVRMSVALTADKFSAP